jgi:hypothetical protein
MERRLLLSTVAVVLALGSVTASAQTPRPSDQDQAAPRSTQAQPAPGQMRANPPSAQNQPNAPTQNAAPPAPAAPSATTGQAAPQQPAAPAANNQTRQPAAGQAQAQPPQQGTAQQGQQQGQTQPAPAQPGMAQQPGNAPATANTGAGGTNGNANANATTNVPQNATAHQQPQPNQQGVITLSEQQNTRVSVAIRQANVRPLTNVSFAIAVGTTIPADVQLNVLPPALVEVVPEYRGYSFVVVEQEALIIDPNSRAIAAVIPFQAQQTTGAAAAPALAPAQAAAPPPREHNTRELTRDQREIQRRQAERHRNADKDKRVIIEERRSTTGAGPREPRVIERPPVVEVYPDGPPVREERHHGLSDLPIIGPLFGPPHDD